MEITTKHEVYDKIFFLNDKKVCNSVIRGIKIEVTSCPTEIETNVVYLCNEESDARVHIRVEEQHAYKTKELLLKAL